PLFHSARFRINVPFCMIRASDQRPGLDVPETHSQADRFQPRKLIRMYEPIDGQMLFRRLKVLTEREDVAMNCTEVLHHANYFLGSFADAEHESGFREKAA